MREGQHLIHAKQLRISQTDAEKLLWNKLRSQQVLGAKFRRQHAIGPYIADFACIEYRLIIELDGGQHTEQIEYDRQRTEFLTQQGFTVLRFWNHDVFEQMAAVMQRIWDVLNSSALTPALSRVRERE